MSSQAGASAPLVSQIEEIVAAAEADAARILADAEAEAKGRLAAAHGRADAIGSSRVEELRELRGETLTETERVMNNLRSLASELKDAGNELKKTAKRRTSETEGAEVGD